MIATTVKRTAKVTIRPSKAKDKDDVGTSAAKPDRPDDDGAALHIAERINSAYSAAGGLKDLIDLLSKNTPGPAIARKYNVSRQRVNQWKNTFGYEEKKFVVRECIEQMLK